MRLIAIKTAVISALIPVLVFGLFPLFVGAPIANDIGRICLGIVFVVFGSGLRVLMGWVFFPSKDLMSELRKASLQKGFVGGGALGALVGFCIALLIKPDEALIIFSIGGVCGLLGFVALGLLLVFNDEKQAVHWVKTWLARLDSSELATSSSEPRFLPLSDTDSGGNGTRSQLVPRSASTITRFEVKHESFSHIYGPFTVNDIQTKVKAGEIDTSYLARGVGRTKWFTVGRLLEHIETTAVPTPSPNQRDRGVN